MPSGLERLILEGHHKATTVTRQALNAATRHHHKRPQDLQNLARLHEHQQASQRGVVKTWRQPPINARKLSTSRSYQRLQHIPLQGLHNPIRRSPTSGLWSLTNTITEGSVARQLGLKIWQPQCFSNLQHLSNSRRPATLVNTPANICI